MNIIKELEAAETARVLGDKKIPQFSPGDTLAVNVKIKEGDRERVQRYEGVCIARAGEGNCRTIGRPCWIVGFPRQISQLGQT